MNFGLAEGLSHVPDTERRIDRDVRLSNMKHQMNQFRVKKARYYADLFKQGTPSNEFDARQYEEFVQKEVNPKISEIMINNPNWDHNVPLTMKMNQHASKYLNNDIMLRSERFKANAKALEDYVKENPTAENDPEIAEQRERITNYISMGNANGDKDGGVVEYKFKKPIEFDMGKDVRGAIALLQKAPDTEFMIKGSIVGERTFYRDDRLLSFAKGMYVDNQHGYNKLFSKMSPEDQEHYHGDPSLWIRDTVKAGLPKEGFDYKSQLASSRYGRGRGPRDNPNSYFNINIGGKAGSVNDKSAHILVPKFEGSDGDYLNTEYIKFPVVRAGYKTFERFDIRGMDVRVDRNSGEWFRDKDGFGYNEITGYVSLKDYEESFENFAGNNTGIRFVPVRADAASSEKTVIDPKTGAISLEKTSGGEGTGEIIGYNFKTFAPMSEDIPSAINYEQSFKSQPKASTAGSQIPLESSLVKGSIIDLPGVVVYEHPDTKQMFRKIDGRIVPINASGHPIR